MIRKLLEIALVLTTLLAACAPHPSPTMSPTGAATSTPSVTATSTSVATHTLPATEMPTPSQCVLEPVIAPTPPAETPGYIELDPDTGLHMTGTAQHIDLESYRLEVSGKVDHPLSLTYDDLRCLPKVEAMATLTCPGFFSDEATWAGAPIREVLALAGVQEGAETLKMISADGFATSIPISDNLYETGFLAYEWEGEPLPILHGFPVRAVLPGVTGGYWVKWLVALEVN